MDDGRPAVEVVRAGGLVPGDEVTETTTPAGPWFRVLRLDRDGMAVVVDDDGHDVDVPVGAWSDLVLVRRPGWR